MSFDSAATNLGTPDANGYFDVFVHDRSTGVTTLESVDLAGQQDDAPSVGPVLSGDGRYVAFVSSGDLENYALSGLHGVYLRDRLTGLNTLASIGLADTPPDNDSSIDVFGLPQRIGVSFDARYVAYSSLASNLAANDTNAAFDVFVFDRVTGVNHLVSVASDGTHGAGASLEPTISRDGRFVAFESSASNLAPDDTNGAPDVYVHDRVTGRTVRCSSTATGAAGAGSSTHATISGDGRRVAFLSRASNLVPGAMNGSEAFVFRTLDGGLSVVSRGAAGQAAGAGMLTLDATGSHVAFRTGRVNVLVPSAPMNTLGVVVVEVDTGAARWVTAGPASAGFDGLWPSIDADGRFVAFSTLANNIAGPDANGLADIYLFDASSGDWPDADGDGHGASSGFAPSLFTGAGRAGDTLDCDDFDATRHVGAPELLDGIDNDCNGAIDDGVIEVYCTSSTTVAGCQPRIGSSGAPRLGGASGFEIHVDRVDGQRQGTFFYGVDNSSFTPLPWASGSTSSLCVRSPIQRTSLQLSGGAVGACDGVLSIDWSAFNAAHPNALGQPFAVGDDVYAQAWFRDPLAPRGTNLSDALRFTLRP